MNIEQIIALGQMGYTKEDIALMMQQPAQAAQPAQPAQSAQPAQPAQTAQPANVDFLEALKMLGAAMQQPAQPAQSAQSAQPAQSTQPAQPAQPTQPTQPAITLTAEELLKLTQGIAVKTAGGTLEIPRTSDSIILGMLDAYEQTEKER